MDPNTLKAFIRLISKEKDLEPEVLKEAIEHAILAVSRKQLSQYTDAVPSLDLETGKLTVTVTKTTTEKPVRRDRDLINLREARRLLKDRKIKADQEVRVPIEPSEFGRIAAQSARQMVMQRLRDAERNKTYEEYKDKEGVMVTGIVQRFEHREIVLNIGKAEGVLPPNEQPMGSHFKFNDRLKVLITRVENLPKGPMIVLSRKAPQLVVELFRQEVPEIADGTVQICGIAREAGVRTKIAVKSINSDVDPVGACVGMKGSRVQMVVRELENEKIDIVPWSSDSSTFIRNALNPAKIVDIELHEDDRRADVTVAQGNLAIAIGRKGQNTKLAARLSGYTLNIRSENEEELAYEEIQRRYLEDFISQIEGLTELFQQAILRSNFNSVEKIAKAELEKLLPFTGDNEVLCKALIAGAEEYVNALHEMEAERRSQHELQEEAGETEVAEAEEGQSEATDAPETEDIAEAEEGQSEATDAPETEDLAEADAGEAPQGEEPPPSVEDEDATQTETGQVDEEQAQVASPTAEEVQAEKPVE